MATGWRSVLCAAAVIVCGTAVHGQIVVLPLVDEAARAATGGQPSGQDVVGRGCVLNPQHEHFSASVSHISASPRFADFVWKREVGEHGRLLQAAMQKVQ